MELVDGGTFTLGSAVGSAPAIDNSHDVTLTKDFYLSKYEVTEAQWCAVMGGTVADPFKPKKSVTWNQIVGIVGTTNGIPSTSSDTVYTINGVTYYKNGFCGQLYLATGVKCRLPTEAEWEYAARGGKHKNVFTYAGSDNIAAVAGYGGNSGNPKAVQPVGGKAENALGLYDMSGNVWEWCSDWYADYVAGDATDPIGPTTTQSSRVLRGGSYNGIASSAQVSARGYNTPSFTNAYGGFRLACSSLPTPNP
jgi:formylglycine-generating enzyme required for sulfatase activity